MQGKKKRFYNGTINIYALPGLKDVDMKFKPQNYRGDLLNDTEDNFDLLMKIVCKQFGTTKEGLIKQDRKENILTARHIFCKLARDHMRVSLKTIGRYLQRDHTTIINCVKKANNYVESDNSMKQLYNKLETKIY